jgi:hypothetical protein
MANNNSPSRATVLNIIDAYEGMLRLDWNNMALRAEWTKWKCVLAGMQ